MKKILFVIIVLLLFPITVFARTPNKEETFKVIRGINNVTVIDGVTIQSADVEDEYIVFVIYGQQIRIPYKFEDNKFSFSGGFVLLDENNKVIGDIVDNEYAFFLYSILENKSHLPYDANTYYNSENLKTIINNGFSTQYKESSNTFGIELTKDEELEGKYFITYNYFLDGDYPVFDDVEEDLENPATGNYSVLITIMLIAVLCIGIYSYVNREKKA